MKGIKPVLPSPLGPPRVAAETRALLLCQLVHFRCLDLLICELQPQMPRQDYCRLAIMREMEMRGRWVYLMMSLLVVALCTSVATGDSILYTRPLKNSPDIPLNDARFKAPGRFNDASQVHITQGDFEGRAIIVTWVVPRELTGYHACWWGKLTDGNYDATNAVFVRYTFAGYQSGYIYSCNITNLEYDTGYWYMVDEYGSTKFQFKSPPTPGPDATYKFGLIGDLGQTEDSWKTLQHYNASGNGQTVLYVGDLSYADTYKDDFDQRRWDSWTQMVEYSAARQPWIWTPGNHEIEYLPAKGEMDTFKSYSNRFPTPYKAALSPSPNYYSFRRASAHIIVLSSYDPFGKYSAQYKWLNSTLYTKVDRNVTPWLIVLMHCPWYNTNNAHYNEGASMRADLETMFIKAKVDIVFSGHVHAYERFKPVRSDTGNLPDGMLCYGPQPDKSAPTHIVIGDGGNREGPATDPRWPNVPPPPFSAFREPSFGYGLLEIHHRWGALWTWYRNDGDLTSADSVTICNKIWDCPIFEEQKLESMK